MTPPQKPFETFKWRWLTVQPTEGLLRPPVFLGVLRALARHTGASYTSRSLRLDLQGVQKAVSSSVVLARDPERNLFRNSGQYWRGTGLLEAMSGEITLTALGQRVARGDVTQPEFASLVIANTVLPNPRTYAPAEVAKWRNANLRIRPFELILAVMTILGQDRGLPQAYLTPNELIQILIPMSGEGRSRVDIAKALHDHRNGNLSLVDWPNCAPRANDKRLAREFLIFLENFGVCSATGANYDRRYALSQLVPADALDHGERGSLLEDDNLVDQEITRVRASELAIAIQRHRIETSVIARPEQRRFRREVLRAAQFRCLLTGERTREALEAAHIVPVEHGGGEVVTNGFCMRTDVHRLFDAGLIRIESNGTVRLNERLAKSVSYGTLPAHVRIPPATAVENVGWRFDYL